MKNNFGQEKSQLIQRDEDWRLINEYIGADQCGF